MAALVLTEVPDAHVSTAVAGDQLSLIWVNDNVVDRDAM
jgi:hypothetical protein